jgi:hypothetical protein
MLTLVAVDLPLTMYGLPPARHASWINMDPTRRLEIEVVCMLLTAVIFTAIWWYW